MPAQPTWIFDFDSTLVRVEALDELADIALQGRADHAALLARIKLITNQGMEGSGNQNFVVLRPRQK
jgi:D-3-phosphoglycerate dehydrogenase